MKRIFTMMAAVAALTSFSVAVDAAGKGEQIFNQKCAMCHKVNGKGGNIGPDLSKISARLKERDIISQLENPKKKNPSSSMPSFKAMSKSDLKELLGYLKALK